MPDVSDRNGGRGLLGQAVLALWGTADPEQDAAFNDWYTHEHLPERIAVPGFLRARRYVADLDPHPRWTYFTLYETDSLATLTSPEYLRVLNTPTPATRRYLPLFAAMCRTACEVVRSVGKGGEGGNLAFMEFAPAADGEQAAIALRQWLVAEFIPEVLARRGTLAVHLAQADAESTAVRDRTESYRNVSTSTGRWLLMVEGAWVDHQAAQAQVDADVAALREHGADVGGAQLFRALARLSR